MRWLPKRDTELLPTHESQAESASADDEALIARLQGINGLDTTLGLHSVRNRAGSYRRLVKLYAESHHEDMKILRQQLQDGDNGGARRTAHSLKGAAGTVGAIAVQAAATELELMLRTEANLMVLAEQIDRVDYLNRTLCSAMREAGGEDLRDATADPIDWARVPKLLQELEALMLSDDARASNCLRDAQAVLQPALGEDYEQLSRQLSRFDFESALTTLRNARSALPEETLPDA